jgi:hypothetical protein
MSHVDTQTFIILAIVSLVCPLHSTRTSRLHPTMCFTRRPSNLWSEMDQTFWYLLYLELYLDSYPSPCSQFLLKYNCRMPHIPSSILRYRKLKKWLLILLKLTIFDKKINCDINILHMSLLKYVFMGFHCI